MAHPRKLMRHAVVAQLTNKTAAGARVQGTRLETYRSSKLPAISVYTLHEPVDPDSDQTSPVELLRQPKVEVSAWVALNGAAADPMDTVDDLAEQIEAAMDADRYLGGTAGDSVLEDTEITFMTEADPLVAVLTLTYAVTYRTTPGTVVPIDDFLRAGVTTQVAGGVPDTAPAEDLVDVRAP